MVTLTALALPIIIIVFGGWLMLEASGRNRVVAAAAETSEPIRKPLASRISGYGAEEVLTYWNRLGDDGRRAEVTFLRIDFLFAIFYSAALAFSIITTWTASDFRISLVLLLVPVAAALAADWTETAIHLKHLDGHITKTFTLQDIDPIAIKIASIATVTKFVGVGVAYLVPVALVLISFTTRGKQH